MAKQRDNNKRATIVIRRVDGDSAGHHGGAWKIAYADFVTALMAFFLVMWLINATTEQRRRGIASYFNPMATVEQDAPPTSSPKPNLISPMDGAPMQPIPAGSHETQDQSAPAVEQREFKAGHATLGGLGPDQGAVNGDQTAGSGTETDRLGIIHVPEPAYPRQSIGRDTTAPAAPLRIVPVGGAQNGDSRSVTDAGEAAQREENALRGVAASVQDAVKNDPEASEDSDAIGVKVTKDGLRIELSDSEKRPMFDTGSGKPNAHGAHLLRVVAPFITALPEKLSIEGYTDAAAFRRGGLSNWTLSGERADATRAFLATAGFPEQRILEVSGRADRDLAVPSDPDSAANRRVVLVLHRDFPQPGGAPDANSDSSEKH